MTSPLSIPVLTRPSTTAPDAATIRKVTVAGAIGNFVEWYDYGIYGLLATYLAISLVGGTDAAALLLTNVGFLVSFLARPFGSVLLGVLGDRFGRRALLATTILLISGATLAIGLIPPFAAIGVVAPVLLILMRVLQGFSAGGEAAGVSIFLAEYAPDRRRNLMLSVAQISSFAALLTGSAFAALLVTTVGETAMQEWVWRLPFLLAGPLGIIGFVIRTRIEETPVFAAYRAEHREATAERPPLPLRAALASRRTRIAILIAVFLPALNGPGYYLLFAYMPTYLRTGLGERSFSTVQAFGVTACALVAIIAVLPYAARLSDRYGRKPVFITSTIAVAVVAVPAFTAIASGMLAAAVIATVVLAIAFAGHAVTIHCMLTELFPTAIRYSAYSIGFAISTIVFGGSAPLVMTALISATGSSVIPAYATIVAAAISLATVVFVRESKGISLRD
jgi:MHS family proline/betaine transporter-like MFS transporter